MTELAPPFKCTTALNDSLLSYRHRAIAVAANHTKEQEKQWVSEVKLCAIVSPIQHAQHAIAIAMIMIIGLVYTIELVNGNFVIN